MNQSREELLFQLALTKSVGERLEFLDRECRADKTMRQHLEARLAAHDNPEQLPPSDARAVLATIKLNLAEIEDEAVGKTIGRYKVLEKVGEGGCGVVYVAEQTEPVRRRVALKVIKLGMDTKQVVARFEAERQALAMMDHPNIAKVLDAGATENGRPYFVMELVRGIKITEYCDQANLTTRERLDLFIKVCQAIQHAHQKGIIHRDIKPSNILVTLHDGVPVPKVIDFGIAKATEGRLTDSTVYTQLHQFVGTPAYMSPEQAEMSGLDIDTRSDIYSLGVLLYELLAGSTPFDANELMSQGIDAMRKTIREKEPVRPSTRFATLKGEELTTTAKRRSADTAKLLHQLKGDLDWIVMKCLEKDRTRRYETANGVAFDLKRHLNNEPVLARPPSAAYKFQKAFRRNKVAFSAGVAVMLALVAGLSLAAIGWRQTRVERDEALEARAGEEAQRKAAQASEQKARAAEAGQTRLREQAEAQSLAARRRAYAADMNLLQQALEMNNLGRAKALLDRQRPAPGEVDLRGWEWRFLWSQTHADEHEVFLAGTNRILDPLSFSADGRLLAREYNGETVVTDLISRRTVLQRTNAWNPVFAHHGAVLAFAGPGPSATNDMITLLNMDTQKETQLVTSGGESRWFGFTPDDRRILMISGPHANNRRLTTWGLTAWDLDTMQPLWQRRILTGYQNYRPYAISPDGAAFAAVLLDGRVEVLETKDGRERFTIKTTEETAMAVMFSPDSSILLTAAGYTDSTIRLWDARNGKAAGSLDGHHSFVSDLIFTPDGRLLISSSGDETIRLWDWATREPAGVLRGHLGEVDGLALTPDGRTLASRCKDGSIYLWDVTKPSRHLGYQKLPDRLVYYEATFTPDSQSILAVEQVGTEGGAVALWDAHTLKKTSLSWAESTNRYNITISGDARWVTRKDAGGHIRVWDVRSASESTNFLLAPPSFVVGFTDNGKFLLTANRSAWALSAAPLVVAAWDTDTWREVGTLRFTNTEGYFTPSLPNSFAIVADGAIRFFDVNKINEASRQIVNPPGNLNSLATSPDGRLAAGAYGSGHVRLWDLTTLQPVATLNGFLLGAHSVAFSPDGRRLAAASNGRETVKLWDSETLQEVLTLSGEGSLYGGLKFSADGRYLLAMNEAGLALLWSAPTWAEIAAAEAKDPPSQGYGGQENVEVKQP